MSGPVRTPVTVLPDEEWGELAVKDETQQKSGAFKYRGTFHRTAGLAPGTRIVAASTGNHASGLALASAERGLHLTVYVPQTIPQAKLARIAGAGAHPVLVEGGYDDCELAARRTAEQTGALFVHSFDDDQVIEGHRSLFRECSEQNGVPDVVFVPVGGGGLVTAALREWGGRVRVIGVEYEQAPALALSLRAGRRITLDSAAGMPEGLLVRRIGRSPSTPRSSTASRWSPCRTPICAPRCTGSGTRRGSGPRGRALRLWRLRCIGGTGR